MRLMTKVKEADAASSLVERIQNGDLGAEQEMVERYGKGLSVMLFNRCRDKALADDVAQDTWLLVIEKIRNKELRDSSRLAGFVTQIAKNQLLMVYRANSKQSFVGEDKAADIADSAPLPDQNIINRELGEVVTLALSELRKPRDRELIRRFYLVGDTKSELCKEYQLTSAHFDAVLSRARQRFKQLWEKYAQAE